jgi:hypothetical protein
MTIMTRLAPPSFGSTAYPMFKKLEQKFPRAYSLHGEHMVLLFFSNIARD